MAGLPDGRVCERACIAKSYVAAMSVINNMVTRFRLNRVWLEAVLARAFRLPRKSRCTVRAYMGELPARRFPPAAHRFRPDGRAFRAARVLSWPSDSRRN